MRMLKLRKVPAIICLVLFLIPFFWLKPGEMDLGGDSSRLYFYDPLSYMIHNIFSPVSGNGVGKIEYGVYSPLPYVAVLFILKKLLISPYILIALSNSTKLIVGFLSVYAILKEIIPKNFSNPNSTKILEISSILGALFYIFSRHMIANYDKALLYHNQVFLNPLVFYLLLKYFLTMNMRYLWVTLVLSFIFASNFGHLSSPAFFSFYPISIVALFLYVTVIRKQKLPWKGILFGSFFFITMHAFHLVPLILDILYPGSHIHTRLFNKESLAQQIEHFWGILAIAKPTINIFLPSWSKEFEFLSFVTPLVVIFGFLLNRKREKTIILTGVFFLLIFFLMSAKITWIGVELYSRLFYIPGFSMFRNFTGIWAYIYSFFYALLFGQALFLIFTKLSMLRIRVFSLGIGIMIILSALQFINGELVNQINTRSNNVRISMVMDPKYEEILQFIKNLPTDGKIISFPFTDCCYEVVHGLNNGAYVGPSIIGYLSGKSVFSGYNHTPPFSDTFWELSKAGDYEYIKKLLGIFNIKYVFHNKDPLVYDTTFPDYPYSPDYVRKYLPGSQKDYIEYVNNLTTNKIFDRGHYRLYKLDDSFFLPHFYIPRQILTYDDDPKLSDYAKAKTFFPGKTNDEIRSIYIERQTCKNSLLKQLCSQNKFEDDLPKVKFEKINKTKYKLSITGVKNPYVLVFLDLYHGHWKLIDLTRQEKSVWARIEESLGNVGTSIMKMLKKEYSRKNIAISSYFNGDITEGKHANTFFSPSLFETWGKVVIADDKHFQVNGYANAWYITPDDLQGRENYELIAEVSGQKVFYITFPISLLFFVGCLLWGLRAFFMKGDRYGLIDKRK